MSVLKEPRDVQVDLELRICYIDYAPYNAKAKRTERLGEPDQGGVAVDYGEGDDVMGIELLDLDDATLRLAADFAAQHELAFPRDLR